MVAGRADAISGSPLCRLCGKLLAAARRDQQDLSSLIMLLYFIKQLNKRAGYPGFGCEGEESDLNAVRADEFHRAGGAAGGDNRVALFCKETGQGMAGCRALRDQQYRSCM